MKISSRRSSSWITNLVIKSGIVRTRGSAELLLVLVSIITTAASIIVIFRDYSMITFNPSPEEIARIQAKVIEIESTLRPPANVNVKKG